MFQINLNAGQTNVQVDEMHQHKGRSSAFSSKTITTRDTLDQTTAQATTLSGQTASVLAGQNINLTGSNIVSDKGTTLAAQNNLNIQSATNTTVESHLRDEKKSGLFSSGGLGITLGTQQQSTDQQSTTQTAAASTIGSTQGDITLQAGKNYTQTGSDILAPQADIRIAAQAIDILEARETSSQQIESKFKQSGITAAISSPVISAVQTAQQMRKAADDTSDPRMKALAAANIAFAGNNAADAIKAGQGQTITDANGTIKEGQIITKTNPDGSVAESRDATAVDKVGGINLNISVGSASSQSQTTQTRDTARPSNITAGNNITITASGAGQDSDITAQGTKLQAGKQILLTAEDQIKLLAAQNNATQQSTNRNKSASAGISIGSNGLAVTAAASKGRGNADGNDLAWTNTQVNAGNQITLNSGSDTTVKGAVVTAPQITANVGGNLSIESQQDTSQYSSKQSNAGGSVSIGASVSGNINASKSNTTSDFASVTEQSGLKAGDEGFNINVANNTDLKAGTITSTQQAIDNNKNTFSTGGQLTTSDLQNQANYQASSIGVNIGTGVSQDGKLAPQGTGAGIGKDSGKAGSTTTAAISGLAGNKDARTADTETGIAKIFDADKVQKEINAQVQITQESGRQAGKIVTDYAQKERRSLQDQLKLAGTEVEKQAIQLQINDVNMQERVMNVLVAAVTGFGSAALTKESLSAAADEMRQLMIEDSKKFTGVTDGVTTLSNMSGSSEGVRGDGVKVGGTRVALDLLCGTANERCERNPDKSLKLDQNGRVVFTAGSIDDFLKTPEGKKMSGPTGGIQGASGTLFGKPYAVGSWQDKLIEAFSGTHDMVGGKLSRLYDKEGNATRGRTTLKEKTQDAWSATGAIVISTPFAMAELLPLEVWKAFSILLGAAK